jgi:hypothetical protein
VTIKSNHRASLLCRRNSEEGINRFCCLPGCQSVRHGISRFASLTYATGVLSQTKQSRFSIGILLEEHWISKHSQSRRMRTELLALEHFEGLVGDVRNKSIYRKYRHNPSMRRVWPISLILAVGCASKQRPVATPPAPPRVIRSQTPPSSAELIEHCVVTKEENANTVSCRCLPVTTKIDSKTGQMVIVCKKMPKEN